MEARTAPAGRARRVAVPTDAGRCHRPRAVETPAPSPPDPRASRRRPRIGGSARPTPHGATSPRPTRQRPVGGGAAGGPRARCDAEATPALSEVRRRWSNCPSSAQAAQAEVAARLRTGSWPPIPTTRSPASCASGSRDVPAARAPRRSTAGVAAGWRAASTTVLPGLARLRPTDARSDSIAPVRRSAAPGARPSPARRGQRTTGVLAAVEERSIVSSATARR